MNNNWSNTNNLYNGHTNRMPHKNIKNVNKKNQNKLYGIIIAIIIVVVLVIIFKNSSNILGIHKNTTGSSEYNASDVDLNCFYETKGENGGTITNYSDFIFNYKDGETISYQLKIYNKAIFEYNGTLTDAKYKEFVDDLESLDCYDDKCTGSHLELSISRFGWKTVVDRIDNKIVMTYYNLYGLGMSATKDDIETMKESYINSGFTCS